jgi:hypothetical protein
MRIIYISILLLSVIPVKAETLSNGMLLDIGPRSADQVHRVDLILKDITESNARKNMNDFFKTPSVDTSKGTYTGTVTKFDEVSLDDQGYLISLRWTEQLDFPSHLAKLESVKAVWFHDGNKIKILTEQKAFLPECETNDYNYNPLGLEKLFDQNWIHFEEKIETLGCADTPDRSRYLQHFYDIKKEKLSTVSFKKEDQLPTRRVETTYDVQKDKCAKNRCLLEKIVTIYPTKKNSGYKEKKSKAYLKYSPESGSLSIDE